MPGERVAAGAQRDIAGKSALVLKAEKAGRTAALKIFDPDLIKRYGEDTQLARIERKKRLVGNDTMDDEGMLDWNKWFWRGLFTSVGVAAVVRVVFRFGFGL